MFGGRTAQAGAKLSRLYLISSTVRSIYNIYQRIRDTKKQKQKEEKDEFGLFGGDVKYRFGPFER